MSTASDRLYELLPATYRIRDAEQGEALRALLAIIGDQLAEVEADIAGLYENWFIETSDEWVVPYIGDLLGVRGLNTIETTAFSQRAYVANTLFYRRRKGTATVLGLLAGDVTGWPAYAVEFFERLQTTQYLNHLRLFNTMPDLRQASALNLLDTPFDSLPHTADVRHISNRRGKHNIPNIGIFLWRLQNYPLLDVVARQAAPPHQYGYHFSPLGNPAPLFNEPAEGNVPPEQRVPGPIRPLDFFFDLKANIKIKAEHYTARSSSAVSSVAINDAEDISKTGLETSPNEWTSYEEIDLAGQSGVTFRYANDTAPTSLEIRLGASTGRLLGTCELPVTGGPDDFTTATCHIAAVSGAQTLVLVYKADCHILLNWLNLGKDTPNSRTYGPQRNLQITRDDMPIPPRDVMCKNLSAWARPPAGKVAVDVTRGRITFAAGEEPVESLVVSYNYGFSADIGGGPYDRRERMTEVRLPVKEYSVGPGKTYASLSSAIAGWNATGKPPAVIRIYDSATYDAGSSINLPKNGMLVLDCENGERPVLVNAAPLKVNSAATTEEETAAFTLSGLVVEGSIQVKGKLNVTIIDTTLIPGLALDEDGYPTSPGEPSLMVSGTDVVDLNVVVVRSITGPIELPAECRGLLVTDSIIDAPLSQGTTDPARPAIAGDATGSDPGPVTTLERVTVFGEVHVKELSLASEVIFTHPAVADRRQVGCVRFSSIAAGSSTPRRYCCQPDLAVETRKKQLDPAPLPLLEQTQIERRVRPQFTSIRYGSPAYGQLSTPCAEEIKTGAENGSEMGAFHMLQQPQRLANLNIALEEYLRFGLEAGVFD